MPPAWLRTRAPQVLGGLVGAGLLFSATLHNEQLYDLLDAGWQGLVRTLGLPNRLPALLQLSSPLAPLLHRARPLPAVLLYGLLYVGLCLGLLFLLVPERSSRRLARLFYGGAGLATGLLLLGSQAGGGPALAVLARELLHFIVSPVPVMLLVPVLNWAARPPATA